MRHACLLPSSLSKSISYLFQISVKVIFIKLLGKNENQRESHDEKFFPRIKQNCSMKTSDYKICSKPFLQKKTVFRFHLVKLMMVWLLVGALSVLVLFLYLAQEALICHLSMRFLWKRFLYWETKIAQPDNTIQSTRRWCPTLCNHHLSTGFWVYISVLVILKWTIYLEHLFALLIVHLSLYKLHNSKSHCTENWGIMDDLKD